jgi:flagellar motor protein MotB
MPSRRLLILLPVLAALLAAGCKPRGSQEVARDARDEAAAELRNLRSDNARLSGDLEIARARLKELESQGAGTIGGGLAGLTGTEGVTVGSDGRASISDELLFEKGKADLKPEAKRIINGIAAKLKDGELANAVIGVEGHTDDTPVSRAISVEMFKDNWGLSAARAARVVSALAEAGIPPERLHGTFRGQHNPRGADKAQNRRVELYRFR